MEITLKLKPFYVLTSVVALSASLLTSAYGQTVEVKDGWVRASVPGQGATGAFMKITAKDGARLVGVASPAAGVAQVHEMAMGGGIMRMREVVGGLDLPAGKTVELKPGGFHLMLMDLRAALPKNSTVALTLTLKDTKGQQSQMELTLPVRVIANEHPH